MTKDYAKPSTTRKTGSSGKSTASKKKKSPPKGAQRAPETPNPSPKKGKLVALLLLLVGCFVYGIYALQQLPETKTVTEPSKPTQKPNKKSAAVKEAPTQEQRFKFYDLLPETEVIPPKVDTYTFKEKSLENDFFYVVQTGSFRSNTDAERQKATIAFQGLKAQIKPVTNAQGRTWYRVETGPFYSRSEMNSALDKLVNIGIEPLVKKIKKQS